MGTSFVSINPGNDAPGFWLLDGILELWLRFLALHIEDPPPSGSVASGIREQWLLASRGHFNGCVPHGMKDAVATDEGDKLVREAVQSLLGALSKAPPRISAGPLNLMGFSGSDFVRDVDTWRLVEVSKAFLQLLDGRITDTAKSTALMPGCRDSPMGIFEDIQPTGSG